MKRTRGWQSGEIQSEVGRSGGVPMGTVGNNRTWGHGHRRRDALRRRGISRENKT